MNFVELTLSRQGGHLRDDRLDVVIFILRFFYQCSVCILYISLCAGGDAGCI